MTFNRKETSIGATTVYGTDGMVRRRADVHGKIKLKVNGMYSTNFAAMDARLQPRFTRSEPHTLKSM
jgi:hypothetical protein